MHCDALKNLALIARNRVSSSKNTHFNRIWQLGLKKISIGSQFLRQHLHLLRDVEHKKSGPVFFVPGGNPIKEI